MAYVLNTRRKSQGVSFDYVFSEGLSGTDIQFKHLIQAILFIPYFIFYLFLSTILSSFLRGGKGIWWAILACYTLSRLLIGFGLVILFRILQSITEKCLKCCDCLFIIRSQKETDLLLKFQHSKTYNEFIFIGNELDNISSSIKKWKLQSNSDDFDYELLQLQLNTMKQIRNKNNINELMQTISHVFRRTFCSLHNSNLYNTYCYIGTKNIIRNYYNILDESVKFISSYHDPDKLNNVSINDRIEYFYRCKRSLGRTALCLSGGGALSMTHCGVIRALVQNDCLPKVISGTSGGAILAGYLGILTDNELKTNLNEYFNYKLANQYGTRFLPTFFEQLFGAYREKILMPNVNYFVNSIKKYVANYTFQEAWLKTGTHLCITVSYSTRNKNNKSHAHHILLNHITSPNVYIWSAITASCALPGLMKPQQLWAKSVSQNNIEGDNDKEDDMVPYYPDGIQWVDGSLQADIPIKTLQELFRVNYTIVSQVNPHVTPFLATNDSTRTDSFGLKVLEMLDDMAYQTVNHQLNRLVKLKAIPAVYGHNFDKFATQNFTGDITIVPRIPLNLRFKILSHPTDADMIQYIEIGEKATWTHLQHIQNVLRIEKLLDKTIAKLKKKQYKKQRILIDDVDTDSDDDDIIQPLDDKSSSVPVPTSYDSSYYLKGNEHKRY